MPKPIPQPIIVGIAVIKFPAPSETFIVTKILGLLDAGLDVQIFAEETSSAWDRFAILNNRQDVRQRLHIGPPLRPLRKVLSTGLLKVLGTFLRHPLALARFVAHNWRHRKSLPMGFLKGIYTRLHFVGQKLDILHIEFDAQAINWIDLKDYLGCKILLSGRGTFQKHSVYDTFPSALKLLFQHVDGYHFISNYLRGNMARLGLPTSVPTWLIEPAIDMRLFTEHPLQPKVSSNRLKIVSVARLAWQKGYEFAIDAVALAVQEGLELEYTIVGEGPYEEPIRFAARQWGLLDNGVIKFMGAVPREVVAKYLSDADMMIHSAIEEGFCNAVIEAQAAGLPVIASDAGGLPENVEDGVTGFIVPRRNPEAMTEKIMLLARDPELRLKMGKAGRERALNRFDLKTQISAFVALYQEMTHAAH